MDLGAWAFSASPGFTTNYPASLTNPVLTPQPPNGIGLGRISSLAEYYQVVPTISYAINEKLSVGHRPHAYHRQARHEPDGLRRAGRRRRHRILQLSDRGRHALSLRRRLSDRRLSTRRTKPGTSGFCFKSPQWFETFTANVTNELGQPEVGGVSFDYPLILSLGTAYTGIKTGSSLATCATSTMPARPASAARRASHPTARVTGLGWKSIVSVHAGAQYFCHASGCRCGSGYQYNPSPIGNDQAFFNVGSPLIIEHILGIGCSYRLTEHEIVSLAYLHGFQNESTGPIYAPGLGAIPGTSVTRPVYQPNARGRPD